MTDNGTVIRPYIPLEDAAAAADVVVLATVEAVSGPMLSLRVESRLRSAGDVDDVVSARDNSGAAPLVGSQWFFFLVGGAQYEVLAVARDERSAIRVLAGLPAIEPTPMSSELRALWDASDAVVQGVAKVTAADAARLEVTLVLKDDASNDVGATIDVTLGYESGEPGGPWRFPTDAIGSTGGIPGYFFLSWTDSGWIVLNPVSPVQISTNGMREMAEIEPPITIGL